jgi:hypothetical protein
MYGTGTLSRARGIDLRGRVRRNRTLLLLLELGVVEPIAHELAFVERAELRCGRTLCETR